MAVDHTRFMRTMTEQEVKDRMAAKADEYNYPKWNTSSVSIRANYAYDQLIRLLTDEAVQRCRVSEVNCYYAHIELVSSSEVMWITKASPVHITSAKKEGLTTPVWSILLNGMEIFNTTNYEHVQADMKAISKWLNDTLRENLKWR